MMFTLLSITITAAVAGLMVRWGLGGSAWGLLVVNVLGSFIAGAAGASQRLPASWAAAILIGFCGCLTTFSGFALLQVRLAHAGEFYKLAYHFFLNNALCLIVCYVGWQVVHKSGW